MVDPLAEVVTLLQPAARFAKQVVGAGRWRIRRSDLGHPFYCAVLEGACRLAVDGHAAIELEPGDFVLVPAAYGLTMTSQVAPGGSGDDLPVALEDGRFRIGPPDEPVDLRILAGHCSFASPDATLLVSLLPQVVHVRGEPRLATFVQLVGDETRADRPAREVMLARLLEVLLLEALRSSAATRAPVGLVRALADPRLAAAVRAMHAQPSRAWTVAELAREAALSRSSFFVRFSREVGVTPMAYLLAWRMALARDLLRQRGMALAEVAERVGYGSATAFSAAYTRYVGRPPTHDVRQAPAVVTPGLPALADA